MEERQWLFTATVRTIHRVTRTPAGGRRVAADVAVGGVGQGVWALALGERMQAGLSAQLGREIAAVEAAPTLR